MEGVRAMNAGDSHDAAGVYNVDDFLASLILWLVASLASTEETSHSFGESLNVHVFDGR